MSRYGAKPGARSARGRPTGVSCATPRSACRGALLARVVRPVGVGGAGGRPPLTGAFSPNIIGERADLNGGGIVNGADDSNAFYGDTSIIDGQLDCNAWGIAELRCCWQPGRLRLLTTAR